MASLALKMAMQEWKKIILIAIVLAFAGSMFIYYNAVMSEMRYFSVNNLNPNDEDKFEGMKVPKTRSEILVSAMTMLIVLAATLFQLNMLVVDMINKKKEYFALKVIGVSEEKVELFPLMYSLLASMLSTIILFAFWLIVFPNIKNILSIHHVSFGLILLVAVVFFALSVIIGVKARYIAEYMDTK
ncbi:hypothetical protein IMX26_13460 [Clostridium sp. 'deep sea']|uniref:hypothetical protein n=1 Tax=Clostridium sp. 'deep sea' TaxID=2779445 RepID=UPI00189688D0|nr:hypothetical protein [Clostridium sp. 'deep sea']QOR34485.1 hypothetical protein IMX26_13460 [Clostridium sp. 'deep sea']